ncbi:lipid-binding SYLF domain-containing protein [Anatilimnocola floriformis]|uniref:lipid-binding SYLF domain-containing protein n=1 Tax=Anatilimnocola floriformis TaxID=2948575 RepID=UPI0020C4310D|nr:lipid-binding SYLF domain-containing protein [Anatilimnocola floriformis]
MWRIVFSTVLLVGVLLVSKPVRANDEQRIVEQANSALHEIMAVPVKKIPETLLEDAHAVAIIPGVIKVGLVAGVQRGRGVVLIRDKGQFGLPRFVSITGGSVGWQIGAQATDFVLVFKSKKSVEGLLEGKFKIGADIAAAAGPVGRRAEASTDLELRAEIYSYSRSRGLFAGVSLDGSVLQLEQQMEMNYYRPGANGLPTPAPESAVKLLDTLTKYTAAADGKVVVVDPLGPPMPGAVDDRAARLAAVQQELARSATQLSGVLDENWRRYLALPAEVFAAGKVPPPETLNATLQRFESVARDPQFRQLNERLDFRATLELLREYSATLAEGGQGKLSLPPPPGAFPAPVVR